MIEIFDSVLSNVRNLCERSCDPEGRNCCLCGRSLGLTAKWVRGNLFIKREDTARPPAPEYFFLVRVLLAIFLVCIILIGWKTETQVATSHACNLGSQKLSSVFPQRVASKMLLRAIWLVCWARTPHPEPKETWLLRVPSVSGFSFSYLMKAYYCMPSQDLTLLLNISIWPCGNDRPNHFPEFQTHASEVQTQSLGLLPDWRIQTDCF